MTGSYIYAKVYFGLLSRLRDISFGNRMMRGVAFQTGCPTLSVSVTACVTGSGLALLPRSGVSSR